jgi:2-dehydro-3-deoxyphosphogalactonate aldolase
MLTPWLHPLPLVAILRGLVPDEAVATGRAIVEAGFRVLEVPLNSPRPTDSIALLAAALGPDVLVGAGTVMTPAQVDAVADAGGRLIVMPHADTAVIRAAKAAGLLCVPGVATPTEAFAALAAGADGLKLFPAEQAAPAVLKAWRDRARQHGALGRRRRRWLRHRLGAVRTRPPPRRHRPTRPRLRAGLEQHE